MNQINIKIRDIKAILKISESGSVSAAADEMGIPQAYMSKIISSFEDMIGLKLFNRTTKGMEPTEFGDCFILNAKALMASHEDLVNCIDNHKMRQEGKVSILGSSGVVDFMARHFVPSLNKRHPEIVISLKSCTDEPSARVVDDVDIILSLVKMTNPDYVVLPLTKMKMAYFASPDFVERHAFTHPKDLEKNEVIMLDSSIAFNNAWEYYDTAANTEIQLDVKPRYLCDNLYSAITLAENGLGVVFSSFYCAYQASLNGQLMRCFSPDYDVERDLYICFKARRHQPRRVQVVIDELKGYIEKNASILTRV